MDRPDELLREIEALRQRLSRLSAASLHINEDLDIDVVLQGALDSARSLTGARYGVMTPLDDGGGIREFLGSGMTTEEGRPLWDHSDRMRFFEYISDIRGPLRLRDFHSHARTVGLPEFPPAMTASSVLSFLAAPIRHRSEHMGAIYVDEKEGEFTREDEDTLVLFAAQAGMAIANARRRREELRARAYLETLIDTSPIGVVVFDALSGLPQSFNREARRMVDSLRDPDQTPEDLLEVLTCIRADGREVSLLESPMAELLSVEETVRAEEMTMRVPDGRSVTVLVNSTPILSDDGAVDSVVVTLQDMADVEELQRLRAEFLGMVSHELRTPLSAIKGSASAIMDGGAELDPAVARQFVRIIVEQSDHLNALVSDLLDVARIETGELPVTPEPAEVALLLDRARNAFISAGGRNVLEIDIEPDLPLVAVDRRRIVQVLGNLLSNAARNSPDSSVIRVSAFLRDLYVAVSVIDQGRGIPAENLPQLFQKFSRVQAEEQGGDTGLGLAICKGIVEAHGGRIWAESDGVGMGARLTFTLPTVEERRGGREYGVSSVPTGNDQGDAEQRVKVLAVDDEPQALRYVRDTLARAGYDPIVTGEPEEALRLMAAERPELALLDLMLPGKDGIELMQELLEIADVPVIFLSAYGREEQVAQAFDLGAEDYVVKPFSPTELAARIRAALRRRAVSEPLEPYALGELAIDYAGRRVTLAGSPVHLTPIEYRLLAELSGSAGRVLTYRHLLERVWGATNESDVRPMRTVVNKLRGKLGDDAENPAYIFTEPRVGYWMPKGEGGEPSS